jgi:DNA modification methylase
MNRAINQAAFERSGWRIHQSVIWVKESPVLTRRDYMGIWEPALYGWKEGKKHYSHRLIRNIRDLWNLGFDDFVSLMDAWYVRRDKISEYLHPTQKPVGLAERAIKLSSEKGNIVLDVFGGSGSTLICCEQVDRNCYLMEMDPFYVDVIIQRYGEFTGKKEVLFDG